MRIDFHFYTIYALARAAGFSPGNARVITYASQYTDDEVAENKITFEDGSEFEPFITAHRIFDPHAVTAEICHRVWVPFHFLPGASGEGRELLVTRPNGALIQAIIDQFLSYDLLPYSRHLLGIILHAYADTWSHQNFLGIVDGWNQVRGLRVAGKDILIYGLAPALGHAQAGSTPDDPSLEWEYRDYRKELGHIINYDRTKEAARHCYLLLAHFLDKFADDFRGYQAVPWEQIENKLMGLFQGTSDLQECVTAWGNAIGSSELGFASQPEDINLIYDEGEWFNLAIRSESKMNPESGNFEDYYYKNDNFAVSDLNYFNDAAAVYWSTLFAQNAEKLGLKDYLNL